MSGTGDYISREAARNSLFIGEQCLYSWDEIDEKIDSIPAADVRPVKRAHWKEYWGIGCSECSECG